MAKEKVLTPDDFPKFVRFYKCTECDKSAFTAPLGHRSTMTGKKCVGKIYAQSYRQYGDPRFAG